MNAYETRVSRAFRGVESAAGSHEDLIPPESAGRLDVSGGVDEPVAQRAMVPDERTLTTPPLSEEEYAAFWNRILAHQNAAHRMAARFVARRNAKDVVHTAAVRCVESLPWSKKRNQLLTNVDAFRRWFLKAVRNHAINCAHIEGVEPPVHANWGMVTEPDFAGRRAGDRELDHTFARNDHGEYDAPAPVERRPQDDVEKLREILREHMDDLPPMQREVIYQNLFEGRKRSEVAQRLGISEKTYDAHRAAAFRFLRVSLPQDSLAYPELDRSVWYDVFEELSERCEARLRRRSSAKKANAPDRTANLPHPTANLPDPGVTVPNPTATVAKPSDHLPHRQDPLPTPNAPAAHRKVTATKSTATLTNRNATPAHSTATRTKSKVTRTQSKATRA